MSESPDDSNCGGVDVVSMMEGGAQPEQLYPDVEMASASRYEQLLEEVKALKQSLAKKEGKIRKQAKALKDLRGMFSKSTWEALTQQHEQRKLMLAETLKLEKNLIETVKGLEECMGRASAQVREKEEEVRKLTKKVSRLRERDQQHKSVNLEAKAMLTEQGAGATPTCRRIAAAILPKEVWEMILGNLSDPKDLWNCTNTCQLFEDLLRPWKTGWMLEQALPYLYRHLPGGKLLECRQVSKGWNAGVDHFLESHPSIQPRKADRDPRRIEFIYPVKEKGIGNRNEFNFGPDEDLSVIEELFPQKLGRNPFIGRYVTIFLRNKPTGDEESLEVEEQRWAKMYALLESYGKEIWNLAFYFPLESGRRGRDRIIELMTSRLFPLVPNLRKLLITETEGLDLDLDGPEELPPAGNLKTLQVAGDGEDGIGDALVRRHHLQLEALEVSELAWNLVHDLEWPNLKELALYFGLFRNDDEEIDWRAMLGPGMPQLNMLTLRLDLEVFDGRNLARLVEAINELTVTSPSLNSFRLDASLEEMQFERLDSNYFVSEGVKTLELIDPWTGFTPKLPSYNFLRYFPFIENLVIILRSENSRGDTEIDLLSDAECREKTAGLRREDEVVEVNKYLYDGQMYKSNIWELLPRLKVLTFQWDVYTRENYEAYAKQRPSSSCTAWGGGSME